MNKIISFIIILISSPVWFIIFILIKLLSNGSIIFKQKRYGKNKKVFVMYKFRTMEEGAEFLQKKYKSLNQASGPVFKIYNDPRFTKVGKILSRTGLDELPQLINIIKGEMTFVGPRPLPVSEAKMVPKKYDARFSVLPGLTSPWVVNGSHSMSFNEWMKSDIAYVNQKSVFLDMKIIILTIWTIAKWALQNIFR